MAFKSEGQGNPGKQPRRKKSVRQELIKLEAIAALLDIVLERAERGEIHVWPCKPVELKYFARCEDKNNVAITCFASPNKWSIRGWHLDITSVDGFAMTHLLTRQYAAVVYRYVEVTRKDGAIASRTERTVIVAHTKDYRAIVAEMFKPVTLKTTPAPAQPAKAPPKK